jgi:hypothetical protein
MTPIFFVLSIILAYFIPFFIGAQGFVSWFLIDLVYLVDIEISRIRFPSEMNGKSITNSEWMTYIGSGTATAVGVFVFFFPRVTPFEFILYFVTSAIVYTFWHHADTGEWSW